MLPRCTDDRLSNFSRLSHRCFCLSSTLVDGCWTDGAEGLFGRALRNRREGSVLRLRRGQGLYCDACEVGLSLLLSWLEGALLFQGELDPSAGELLKLSSSSIPLAASNCVFSSRVIKRSSSSPNSPPISVGSPTTITS